MSLFRCLHFPPDNPNKVRKQACSLIAFKQLLFDSNECAVEASNHQNAISQLSSYLCEKHKVSIVKRFGDVYIGCIGFFDQVKDWGSAEDNAIHTIQFACDLFNLGAKYNLHFICAIDYGRVVGGYMEDIFTFDMFGPEILWVLSVCESISARKIIVSKSVHGIFTKSKLSFPFALEECNLHLPGRKQLEKAISIKNIEQYDIFAYLECIGNQSHFELNNPSVDNPVLPWYIIQQMLLLSKVEEYIMGPTYSNSNEIKSNYLQYFTRLITEPIHKQLTPFLLKKFPDIQLYCHEKLLPKNLLLECKNNFFTLFEEDNEVEIIFLKFQQLVFLSLLCNIARTFPLYFISKIKSLFLIPIEPNDVIQKNSKNSPSTSNVTYNETILFDAFRPPFDEEWKFLLEILINFKYSISQYLSNHLNSQFITSWNYYLSLIFVIEANDRISPTSIHSDGFGTGNGNGNNSSRIPTYSDVVRSRVSSHIISQGIKSTIVETSHAHSISDNDDDDTTTSPITRNFYTLPTVNWNYFKNRNHFPNYRYSDLFIYIVYSILCYSGLAHLDPTIHDTHITLLHTIGVYPLAIAVTFILWCSVVFMDKNHPPIIYIMLIGIKIFITCVFPLNNLPATHTLLFIFMLWNYFSLDQEILLYCCENILTIFTIIYRNNTSMITIHQSNIHDTSSTSSTSAIAYPYLIIEFQLFFLLFYIIAEFYTYLCYLIEYTLIPYQIKVCQEEISLCRQIFHQYAPHISLINISKLYLPRRYKKCAILAFHIKAAESIPAVVDVDDVTSLIAFLYSFMDDCVQQFGLLSK